jgi:hypothetical protein
VSSAVAVRLRATSADSTDRGAAQILEHLLAHAGADAAGIDKPAVVRLVAEQKRAEMWARSFRIAPSDHHEFLAIEAFALRHRPRLPDA